MAKRLTRWTVAAIQMTSTDDVERNLDWSERWIRRAAGEGARLVALPENFAFLRWEGSRDPWREPLDGPAVRRMARLARELSIHLLLGSISEKIRGSRRHHNTSVLIGPDGRRIAAYRKIHLFDIDIPGKVSFTESKNVAAGKRPILADTALGKLGLSICYDLRFPELYRHLALRGAEVLFVPAAFTAQTGPDHWLPLLRARAIENLCWVVAPTQVGRHNPYRHSHGEVAIIDPWGRVVARRPRRVGYVTAEIDLDRVREARRGLPALDHLQPNLLKK